MTPSYSPIAAMRHHYRLLLLLPPLLLFSLADAAISFNFPPGGFSSNIPNLNITYQKDASSNPEGAIELTKNVKVGDLNYSSGRATYSQPIRLWDKDTRNLTNFTTSFSFLVEGGLKDASQDPRPGDGLAFFIVAYNSSIPERSGGGNLTLFNDSRPSSPGYIPTVAVEFDTFPNIKPPENWDPTNVTAHVGIDIGSISSVKFVNWTAFDRSNKSSVSATVTYDASTTNLSAYFTDNGTQGAVSYIVDLRDVLPENVSVGFSAATGNCVEIHRVFSWNFTSTLDFTPGNHPVQTNHTTGPPADPDNQRKNIVVLVGVLSAVGLLTVALGIVCFLKWRTKTRRWRREVTQEGGVDLREVIRDSELEGGRVPKSFAYRDLARATKNFALELKLGKGGFGDVYRGVLSSDNNIRTDVAIKRVSKDSHQGKKEYISEIKIISRLRHRNLVQLVGWCHERGELLLVYEYMPKGSLDTHLYSGREEASTPALPWPTRHGIVQGVAAALLYLHEEWEQCVVHRDVKPSNVLLDSQFNAKLGDFGLARLVDHGQGLQTTLPAGTMGYLAPEFTTSGKASKESDVYSFGVVALEIACGRKPIEPEAPDGRVRLVNWVWDLHGKNSVLEAADPGLNLEESDKKQIERVMMVGLWCVHPDWRRRPSMKQVVSSLTFETPPPDLPAQMPVASYDSPTEFELLASITAETSSPVSSGESGPAPSDAEDRY